MIDPFSFPDTDEAAPRRGFGPVVVVSIIAIVVIVASLLVHEGGGDPGALNEDLYAYDVVTMGPAPTLVDATGRWGLAGWKHTGSAQFSGGVVMEDLDGDGRPDLVVGGGDLAVFFNHGEGFDRAAGDVPITAGNVTAVGAGDLDGDGFVDLLVASALGPDVLVWGGAWIEERDLARAEITQLEGGSPSTALLAVDLTGDEITDILRLGYGTPDVVFVHNGARHFVPLNLPDSDRMSLSAELLDADEDGLVDIWVTRDVGWREGGDAVYSRRGDPTGAWVDVAPELGADLEVDGMGVTAGDLNGDRRLDVYVSDLGDNELLLGSSSGAFERGTSSGLGRIRPPGSATDLVSSSWGAGIADINRDGRPDLVVANGGLSIAVANKVPGTTIEDDDTLALFLGDGAGRFADVWPELGLAASGRYRGLALGDIDGDGDPDVVAVAHGGGILALRNDTEGNTRTVVFSRACAPPGTIVAILEGPVSLVPGHTFLGRHARQLTVPVGTPAVVVSRPGAPPAPVSLQPGDERTIGVTC